MKHFTSSGSYYFSMLCVCKCNMYVQKVEVRMYLLICLYIVQRHNAMYRAYIHLPRATSYTTHLEFLYSKQSH
jgi:hypothetical protein